jgi:hypothetical protein
MFMVLDLITLDLLCSHSDAVPQYLEETIRDSHPMYPIRPKPVFHLIQQAPGCVQEVPDLITVSRLAGKSLSSSFQRRSSGLSQRQLAPEHTR